jgi:transposase
MLVEGSSVKSVCDILGLTRNGVEKIRARWNRFKFSSLEDRPRSGRPAVVGPVVRQLLVRTLDTSPLKFGYAFTVWTTARLSEHLFQKTKIRVSPRHIRRLLRKEGFTFGIPAHTLKGKRSEKQHRQAKKRLGTLKKGRCAPILAIGFALPMRPASTSIPT